MTAMCSSHDISLSEMLLLRSLTGRGRRPNMLVVCLRNGGRGGIRTGSGPVRAAVQVCLLPGCSNCRPGEGNAVPSRYRRPHPASADRAVRLVEHGGERGPGGVDDRVGDATARSGRSIPRGLVLPAEHHLDRRRERLIDRLTRQTFTFLNGRLERGSQEIRPFAGGKGPFPCLLRRSWL